MYSLANQECRIDAELFFTAPLELGEICARLEAALQLPEFVQDAEDTWEWCFTQVDEAQREINISRKHDDGVSLYDERVRVMLLARADAADSGKELLETVGQVLADVTGCSVFSGTVKYLGGNDLEYLPEREFRPGPDVVTE